MSLQDLTVFSSAQPNGQLGQTPGRSSSSRSPLEILAHRLAPEDAIRSIKWFCYGLTVSIQLRNNHAFRRWPGRRPYNVTNRHRTLSNKMQTSQNSTLETQACTQDPVKYLMASKLDCSELSQTLGPRDCRAPFKLNLCAVIYGIYSWALEPATSELKNLPSVTGKSGERDLTNQYRVPLQLHIRSFRYFLPP